HGGIMLPYFYQEIVPLVLKPRVYRFGIEEEDKEANVRGIIEAQCLSIRLHSQWLNNNPIEIIATGGGSENREILQILADVFHSPIKVLTISDSAALGAALRSAKSYANFTRGNIQWSELVQKCKALEPLEILNPLEDNKLLYDEMLKIYERYESFVLQNGTNPEIKRVQFKEKYS
ncbi:MAG: FGGY-family carbohydrate kinase, partial [Candidatus Lokiarchaeota archaeon]